ncbi:MAG: competence/damage-inducible protein A [Candidatus Portiera sp.]|nr:competence/damage-inducible protein A [Portiera sp.]
MAHKFTTAAFLIIGNEILDGSTKDKNLAELIAQLNPKGILVREVRVVRDEEVAIIDALKQFTDAYDFVFTSGGIGPTHDDITTSTVAKFFGKELQLNQESLQTMQDRYKVEGRDLSYMNDYVMKMAYLPQDAVPIKNSISAAPGFQIGKVYVLAGVPNIFQAMLESLLTEVPQGRVMHSSSMLVYVGESRIAEDLEKMEEEESATNNLEIGSYPRRLEGGPPHYSVKVVARSDQPQLPNEVLGKLQKIFKQRGIDCKMDTP